MNKKKLYLLCGCQGSGKSTWAGHLVAKAPQHTIHISRDKIRFNLVKENEPYFSHEDEVFETFINTINEEILYGKHHNIIVDATHINEHSRNKVLDRLRLEYVNVICVNFNVALNSCLKHNALRIGTRGYVPHNVITKAHSRYVNATFHEKHAYDRIITIN